MHGLSAHRHEEHLHAEIYLKHLLLEETLCIVLSVQRSCSMCNLSTVGQMQRHSHDDPEMRPLLYPATGLKLSPAAGWGAAGGVGADQLREQ